LEDEAGDTASSSSQAGHGRDENVYKIFIIVWHLVESLEALGKGEKNI
jgi:hypothetical protein